MLVAYRCVSIRESKPEQLKKLKIYWLDEDNMYTDSDGDTFVDVYADAEGRVKVGTLNKIHFNNYIAYTKYGCDLSSYINETYGILLIDIISYCEKTRQYDMTAKNVLKYIEDKGLNIPENYFKEYFIKSMPIAKMRELGVEDDYIRYTGYSVICA